MKHFRKIFFVLALFTIPYTVFPQFLRAWGLFAGETSSRHRYKNKYPQDFQSDPAFLHAQPPSHKGGEFESWSAGIFLEMLRSDVWRWQTEIEYCNKGSKENELVNWITDQQVKKTNKLTYIQWNNFLKRYINLGFRRPTYIMIGVRGEYNLSKSTPAYSYISGNFKKLWVSPDLGIGMEFKLRGNWSLFAEEHYNPDAWFQYTRDSNKIWAMNRTWETRVGLIYRIKQGIGAYDLDCNAPKYHGR
ncbi:MAG TPA: hypothetical protein VNZ49_16550 [Bacteroidia bacterium]|jgi:hypothetical protein|nr:hypothetical protein [Bacteroidia bacterium]